MKKNILGNWKWAVHTIGFVSATIIMLLMLQLGIAGMFLIIIFILTIIVGSILRTYYQKEKEWVDIQQKKLDQKTIANGQQLLRYATAVLSFLSLTTTAKGMQSFVFETSWMAYIGSFAVQSILVVFSLLLCRFYVQVQSLRWHKYVKKIVSNMMILFFCVAITVSSTFSYSYIANYAYKDSWANDCETIIQKRLLENIYKLKEVNEYRGKIILNEIVGTADQKLSEAIKSTNRQKEKELTDDWKNKISTFGFEKQKKGQVKIDKATWLASSPELAGPIEALYNEYESKYEAIFENAVDEFNNMIDVMQGWEKHNTGYSEIKGELSKMTTEIARNKNLLEPLITGIDGWSHSLIVRDNESYRYSFRNSVQSLIREFDAVKTYLEELDNILQNLDDLEKDGDTSKQLKKLLSDIYLLGTDEKDIVEIIKNINQLAISVARDESYDSNDIYNIVLLEDTLKLYQKYIDLKGKIENFIDNQLQKTYQVIEDKSEEDEDANQELKDSNAENESKEQDLSIVYESQWKDIRNTDFNTFYTLAKSLPSILGLEEKNSIDKDLAKYDANNVIEDSMVLQRDLLGQIRDFEKAFNYMKYQFRIMAYFSMFIAIFFDLAAFLTGCFLYSTEYFETKESK